MMFILGLGKFHFMYFIVCVFQCLLRNGADLDNKNEEEETPLHLAAKHGRTK